MLKGRDVALEEVLREIGEHLETADRLALQYAVRYMDAARRGGTARPPHGLRPEIAKMVREVVLDARVAA